MSKDPKKKKGNAAGIIAFGITFVLLSSVFKIHGLLGLGVELAVSAFVSAVIRTMAQGLDLTTQEQKKKQAEQAAGEQEEQTRREQEKQADSLEKIRGNTGNPDVDALLERGREMILEIRQENEKIPNESLTEKLNQLETLCSSLFHAVYEKPAKAPQIRKFMEYYLPTTLKMVKSYRLLGERQLPGEEAEKARRRIDDALSVVVVGCQKMLRNLYKDDMLDIVTDIDVLEQMLKRDGLTESDLEKAAEQARQAARIDAAASEAQAASAAREERQPSAQSAPALSREDSDVTRRVSEAYTQAQQHVPQAPTLSGGVYPTYGNQAQAQQPAEEEQKIK